MIHVYRQIIGLLDARERRGFIALIGVVLLMGIFEAGGLASVIPFLKVLSDPGIVERNTTLKWLYEEGGFGDTNAFLIAIGVGVFCIILAGTFVKIATFYIITRFGQMRNYSLTSKLFARYLGQNYSWFLTRHSAHLSKNILSEVTEVVNTAILPAVHLISYTVIAVAITTVLVVADPTMALAVSGALSAAYAVIYLFSRARLARIGADCVRVNRDRFQVVHETFGGIKHVKLRGMEDEFLSRFKKPAFELARLRAAREMISDVPRYVLEAVLLGGIMLVVLVKLFASNGDIGDVLPVVGLYAFAGIRLFPVMQHIYRNVSKIRAASTALNMIAENLALGADAAETSSAPAGAVRSIMDVRKGIELRSLSFTYPGSEKRAIDNISLFIEANKTVAFVGATGSGKTTLVDIILGLLPPDKGQLLADGVEINGRTLRGWQRSVGYVPQNIFLADESIARNIAYGVPARAIDHDAVERAARIARLHDFVVSELPNGYDTLVGEHGVRLSGGQRQRIGVARALYHNPEVLVLDEATSALDNITERAVMEAVHGLSSTKTIIIIAHRLSTVRECDTIFMIDKGRLSAQGTFRELLSKSETFRSMCGELTA